MIAEFVVNNKVHTATKISPFIANYRRELRIGADIRRKEKVEKAIEFVERMKKVQEKARAVLKEAQKNMKRQADRKQQEVKSWKKNNKMMLSTKDLVFKERLVKKLTERYVGPYKVEKVVLKNTVKLKLPISIRIHSVVNVSRIKIYRELVKRQKMEKPKLVKVEEVEE